MAQSEKLLRLLQEIHYIDRREGATLQELMEGGAVSARTVYRDIEALSQSGLPVLFDPETKRYRFLQQVFLQPLTFTVREATALVQCVQGMCKDDLPIRPDLRHALEKILSCLPIESQKKVDAGRQAVDIRLARQSVSIERGLFQQVEAAIRERRQMRLRYYTKSRETWTERILDPYVIVFRGRAWYVVGFCHLRGGVKLFRLDRMEAVEALLTTFELPKNFSPDAFFAGSWLIEQGETVRVQLRFAPEAARWVRDEQFHESQQTEDLEDGSILYSVCVQGTREITRWILGYGGEVEVLAPESLRAEVAAQGRRMAAMYGDL